MIKSLSTLLILILFIAVQADFTSHRPFIHQRNSFQRLQLNSCSYGGGKINNSTVIELGNCFNYFYFIGLNIGTGPQYFNFQFDTGKIFDYTMKVIIMQSQGSPTLWIPLGANPTGFNQNASSTYTPTNQSQTINYGDGTGVSGNMGYDILSIPQTSIQTNYSILFVSNSTVTFDNTNVYGLVGMDYNSYPNFIDLAYQSGVISTSVFALSLNNTGVTSYLYYNDGLPEYVKKGTMWVQMTGPSEYWQLELLAFSIGGNDMSDFAADVAVIDSGTSLLVLNQELYNAIIKTYFTGPNCMQQSGIYCPCQGTYWPDLAFMFNTIQVVVPGSAYRSNIGNGTCQVNLQTLSGVSQLILGDIFFRQYIISFDRKNLQVGFYGKNTPLNNFNPQYFVLIQYIMCGVGVLLSFVGIGFWIYVRSAFEKQLKQNLGTQLLTY